jgi:magnesium-transporting ATPase (P-type)
VSTPCLLQVYGFSSAKKMASCVLDNGDGTLRVLNKGASEWVLDISTHVHETDGSISPLTAAKKAELLQVVTGMASRGLRTLVRCLSLCTCRSLLTSHAVPRSPAHVAGTQLVVWRGQRGCLVL